MKFDVLRTSDKPIENEEEIFNTLEELILWIKKQEHPVIIMEISNNMYLEIYDSYRE